MVPRVRMSEYREQLANGTAPPHSGRGQENLKNPTQERIDFAGEGKYFSSCASLIRMFAGRVRQPACTGRWAMQIFERSLVMQKQQRSVRILIGVGAVAGIVALCLFLGFRLPAASADTSTIPPASVLFDDLDLPYFGLGAVWIDPEGVVIVRIGDKHAVGFKTNAAGLKLVETNGKVEFYQGSTNGTVLYQFPNQPVPDPQNCSLAFDIAGYIEIDYDQKTGMLEIAIEGAKQVFETKLSLENSKLADPGEQSVQNQCRCECPDGTNCTQSCDPGYFCRCRCRCGASSSSCDCSSCVRNPRTDVLIVSADLD